METKLTARRTICSIAVRLKGPNQIWQADHTQLDLRAKRDDGQLGRPWLSVIIDDYSRAIVGFLLSFNSSSALQTALVLLSRKVEIPPNQRNLANDGDSCRFQ
jgi:transposase InsO family protein